MSFGNGGSDSPCHGAVIELVDFLVTVDSTCHLPPPRSGDSAAAGPRLLIRQACRLLISQLASISEVCSPIHHLVTRLVAYSLAPAKLK